MNVKTPDPPTARDLFRKLDLDWKSFAEWADPLLPGEFDPSRRPGANYAKFAHGFHTQIVDERLKLVCPVSLSPCEFVTTAIATMLVQYCADNVSTDSNESLRATQNAFGRHIGQRLWEIASSASLARAQARRRVLLDKDYGRQRRMHLMDDCAFVWERRNEISTAIWNVTWQRGFDRRMRRRPQYLGLRWARWMLRRPAQHERAFWTQLQIRLREDADLLAGTEEMIEQGTPLAMKYQLAMQRNLARGTIVPITVRTERGRIIQVAMRPNRDLGRNQVDLWRMHFIVPLAYRLVVQWASSRRWPQFVIPCRNPECGKRFYSARPLARTCPRRPGTPRRSDCKSVWENYQKWLKKEGHDPDNSWSDDNLKQEFLRHYTRRGPQS